jgi:hypothetical protein
MFHLEVDIMTKTSNEIKSVYEKYIDNAMQLQEYDRMIQSEIRKVAPFDFEKFFEIQDEIKHYEDIIRYYSKFIN